MHFLSPEASDFLCRLEADRLATRRRCGPVGDARMLLHRGGWHVLALAELWRGLDTLRASDRPWVA